MGCILSPMCIVVLTNSINIYSLCFLLALQIDFFIRERTEYYVLPMQLARYELGFNPVMAAHRIQKFMDNPHLKREGCMTVSHHAEMQTALIGASRKT